VSEPPPPAERADQMDLHVWTEPVTLIRNATEAQGSIHPVVIPIGFEYRLNKPWWFGAELTLLYRSDEQALIAGGILAISLQMQIGHLGPIAFFAEPRAVAAAVWQAPNRVLGPGATCIMGCVIETTELEAGFGANFGAAIRSRLFYVALYVGAQLTWYSGGNRSAVGDPFGLLRSAIFFNEHGDAVSPNLSILRLGVTF
jgi:hypothetical protein